MVGIRFTVALNVNLFTFNYGNNDTRPAAKAPIPTKKPNLIVPLRSRLDRDCRKTRSFLQKIMDVKNLHLPTARAVHDGPLESPFWGVPTATIDWCEESKLNPIHLSFYLSWEMEIADTLWK